LRYSHFLGSSTERITLYKVLTGIANSNYEFIYFNFDTNCRVSDGGVLEYTDSYDKLQNECLKTPESSDVKGRKLPYVFVGDDAFSLIRDFLKPYNVKQLTRERKIFNYRLSRARRIIENVFGILVAKDLVYLKLISMFNWTTLKM
jgi:hypothetical protein